MRHRNIAMFAALLLIIPILAGCTLARSTKPAEIQYYNHKVKYSGETLGIISKWYTGRSAAWEEILSYNPGLDVRRMMPGDVVRIPTGMLKRTDPLPGRIVEQVRTLKVVVENSAELNGDAVKSELPTLSDTQVSPENSEAPLIEASLTSDLSSEQLTHPPASSSLGSEPIQPELAEVKLQVIDTQPQAEPAHIEAELIGQQQKRIPSREELWKALNAE